MGKDQELLEAARNGNVLVVEKILNQRAKRSGPLASLRRGPGANVQDTSGYTPLHHAALNGHKEIVRLLLEHEASPNVPDTKGSSPLHLAAWAGHTDIVRLLLTHGPAFTNVNLATRDNETALHCAAQYGHTAVVSMLLNHGADPTVRSSRDESALDLACQYGRIETVELLVRMHPELLEPYRTSRGFFPHTPLHRASRNGHRLVVDVLLSIGHAPNARTPSGTALHEAALCGKMDVVRALLIGGADPRARDTKGATVLDVLSQFPERATHEIVKLINKYRSSNGIDSDPEDLPPIPVSNMIDGPDSPYDNVRTIPSTQTTLQGRGRSRGNQQSGVWERREEDERRVSATSNISMNNQIVPSKSTTPPSHSFSKSSSSSSYMLLLTSGCFGGGKEKSDSNRLHRLPSDCYKYDGTKIASAKSETHFSTLRIGKSKFFRRKTIDSKEKLLVIPKDSSVKVNRALPMRKKSSLLKNNTSSLPNILEAAEKSTDSDESSSSDKIVNNPMYVSFENTSHINDGNSKIQSSSSDSEDLSESAYRSKTNDKSDISNLSARSSFEFKSSEVEIKSLPRDSLPKLEFFDTSFRQRDSNITLKNWTDVQTDFKNASNYDNVELKNKPNIYYAMLDFSKMANLEKNQVNKNDYEPIEFNSSDSKPRVPYNKNESIFEPIEVFKDGSTVFVPSSISPVSNNISKSETVDVNPCVVSDSESDTSRSLSLVDSTSSKSKTRVVLSKIKRTLSKMSKKTDNRSSLNTEVGSASGSTLVHADSLNRTSSFYYSSNTSSLNSNCDLYSNNTSLSITSILNSSTFNTTSSEHYGTLQSTALLRIGEVDDPVYENIHIVPKNFNQFQDIPRRKSNYHIKGSANCQFKIPKNEDYVYVFNNKHSKDNAEPFVKIPRRLLGSSSDVTVCFCDQGDKKIYVSADNILETHSDSTITDSNNLCHQRNTFVCYCSGAKCESHYLKDPNGPLFLTCKPLTHSVSFPNLRFSFNDPGKPKNVDSNNHASNILNASTDAQIADKSKFCFNESSAFTKFEPAKILPAPRKIKKADHIDATYENIKFDSTNKTQVESPACNNEILGPLYVENPLYMLTSPSKSDFDNGSVASTNGDSDGFRNENDYMNLSVSLCVCHSLTDVGGCLCVRRGSDGGHYPYSRSQMMDGSYHSEELSSSYQSGRVREADQLSISSTTSCTGGPSPRERQRCGTNDSSVSGGNSFLPTGSSGYYAHSPGSNSKVSPTPPKKPPRRNLSVSPTHLLPPLFPSQCGSTGNSAQSHHLARAHQTRSQDDLDDIQAGGSKLTGLRHGRSVDQYVDNDLKTSPRSRPIPQPRPSLALLASKRDQPVAISTMYENVIIKEQNPKRKLRRNQYENYHPEDARNQRYNSSQERSSLESLLDDVGSNHGGTPSDVESRPCRNRPTIQTPLSPTHYEQPPTPEHPPPSAKQAELSIHEKMRPLSQEYKRMSRDMETEIDFRYLGRCSSPSSSASTDHCVEEYVAEVPFGGLFKGSTTALDGVGTRPTPAERPKSLRTLKSVYDGGGGPFNYHPNTINQIHIYNHQQYQPNPQNYQGSNQSYHGTQINPIDRTGMYKTELEDPWQYRAGREPKDEKKESSGSGAAVEKSLSILSPFDEQEEWAKISEIMASFGSKLVRESVFAEELEREFQSRLGLAGAIARRTPSPAPEVLQQQPDTIPTWLSSIGLGNLELNFINNGYDELTFINGVIEDNDFEEMAISEPEKSKLLEAVQSLPKKIEDVISLPRVEDSHNNNISDKAGEEKRVDPAAVDKWLQSIGLECYQDTFRKHLYADMERVRRIWEVELTAVLEIQKVGHRRRILASVAGRQNGPSSNMEEIKADFNNLQKNLQNLKAEIKDIPIIECNKADSIQTNQIPITQAEKSPSTQSQISIGSVTTNQNNTIPRNSTESKSQALVPPGGETLKRSHKKNRPPPPPPARDLEIRAPCELLVGVPGALKTQWRHQPFALVTSSVMYVANYLGSTIVKELRGTESTQKSIQKLKKTNSEPRALPDIILSISYRGVKFLNTITRELVCEHEIRNIHCACQDADDLTHFAYLTKDITSKNHYCHVFCVATMDQATEVILTLGQAFEVAYQMALKEMAPKSNPQNTQQQPRSQSSNQISQQSKTPTHEKPSQIKDKNNQVHGRSHSVTEIKLNGHQLKVAPMTISLSNEDFQLSAKNGNIKDSPRTPSTKAPIAVAEEL